MGAAAFAAAPSPAGGEPAGLELSGSFSAFADPGKGTPPDPQGAAGPQHLVSMTNTGFTVQSKNGSVAKTWTPSQFWASVSRGDLLFDPRVMYDALSGRWIAVMATAGQTAAPAILVAVSDGTDPTQGWSFQRIPADLSGAIAPEFPLLGANARWICVTANLISLSTGESNGVAVWAIEKTPLFASGTLSISRFAIPDAASPVAPVVTFDAGEPDEFLAQQWSSNDFGHGQLELLRVTEVGGQPALRTVATISAPVAWIDRPSSYDVLPQASTSRGITAGQDDVASACLRNGEIWAVQTATIPAGTAPLHSVVQWWRVTPAGELSGFGRIGDVGGATWVAYPSVAVNARDQVLIGYSIFSATSFPSAGYSLRTASGCDGSLGVIHALHGGEAAYVQPDASGLNRWGDLTETVVDPSDDLSMWTIQEYAAPQQLGASRWGTWWGGVSPAASGREESCFSPAHEPAPGPVHGRNFTPE